ncbi:hypothetical protein [Salinibacterium xinjiangense]|uniref:hypothetical protein n=1 Tax=Salinibacterium xinjiangense TaxID=386302 RepID=UPI0015CC51E8|nr:hypothetical protein [Salinibacterium xinjiangense]
MQRTTSGQERELWRRFFVMRRQPELTLERRPDAAGAPSADFEIVDALNSPTSQE